VEEVEDAMEEAPNEEDAMDEVEVAATDEDVVVVMDEDVEGAEEQVREAMGTMTHEASTCKTKMLSLHYRVVRNAVRIRTEDKCKYLQ
jgi:hypothetical protein